MPVIIDEDRIELIHIQDPQPFYRTELLMFIALTITLSVVYLWTSSWIIDPIIRFTIIAAGLILLLFDLLAFILQFSGFRLRKSQSTAIDYIFEPSGLKMRQQSSNSIHQVAQNAEIQSFKIIAGITKSSTQIIINHAPLGLPNRKLHIYLHNYTEESHEMLKEALKNYFHTFYGIQNKN